MRRGKEERVKKGRKERLPVKSEPKQLLDSVIQEDHGDNELAGPDSTIQQILQHMDEIHQPSQSWSSHFEVGLFMYLITHLLIQNYNIYRVVSG